MEIHKLKSDSIGIMASSLCMIHCILTPFFFAVKTCSASCCQDSPIWWRLIDFTFLAISLFAIQKIKTENWIKSAMWVSWSLLVLIILNENLQLINIFNNIIYIPAFALIALHFYNLKYCQCSEESC